MSSVMTVNPETRRRESSLSESQESSRLAEQPLVSICISAYNVEQYFPATLASVLNQTYANIEVIILDNGSTDGTAEVIGSLSDPRVRAVQVMPNIGGYQGMNRAVSYARGDFIAVYHSDDIYEPTIVEKEVAYLQNHPDVGAVFTLDHYMDEDGKIFGKMTMPKLFEGRQSLTYDDVFRYTKTRSSAVRRS